MEQFSEALEKYNNNVTFNRITNSLVVVLKIGLLSDEDLLSACALASSMFSVEEESNEETR